MRESGGAAEAFLAEFSAHLEGRGGWRRRVEAEMRDGLYSAIEDGTAGTGAVKAGGDAEACVVRAWGGPRELAAEFNGVWRVVRARCLARRVVIATPLLAVLWAAVALLSRDPWTREPAFVAVASRVLAVSVAVALVSAVVVLRTHRRSALHRRVPLSAAAGILGGMVAATVTVGALLLYRATAGPDAVEWVLVIAPGVLTPAVLVATVRDALSVRAAGRLRSAG
jgi:hypothetical protein